MAQGRPGWLKRIEDVDLRRRLLKGEPRQLFEAERQAYKSVAESLLPFPSIIEEGADHFVIADAGPTVKSILQTEGPTSERFREAVCHAGEALARLHSAGVSHGRPALRDICWQDGRLEMIDLERVSFDRGKRAMALDLAILVQGWFARRGGGTDDAALLDAALGAYRPLAPEGVWPAFLRLGRAAQLLRPLLALARGLRPGSKEIRAGLWTLDYLRRQVP